MNYIASIITIIVIVAIFVGSIALGKAINNQRIKSVGKRGEKAAIKYLQKVLQEDDLLFSNVKISFNGKETELDDVIVNKYGVFIFEVKTFVGELSGTENDKEWTKVHTTPAGNTYIKTVRNPIRQVKRQIYILASYFKENKIYVFVNGYAIFAKGNCPLNIKEHVLRNSGDIDKTIHSTSHKQLNQETITKIQKLLDEKQ